MVVPDDLKPGVATPWAYRINLNGDAVPVTDAFNASRVPAEAEEEVAEATS